MTINEVIQRLDWVAQCNKRSGQPVENWVGLDIVRRAIEAYAAEEEYASWDMKSIAKSRFECMEEVLRRYGCTT